MFLKNEPFTKFCPWTRLPNPSNMRVSPPHAALRYANWPNNNHYIAILY